MSIWVVGEFRLTEIGDYRLTLFGDFRLTLTSNKRCNFIKVIIYTFLFSLSIELLQPLINGFRSSDITDLITNTCGGAIGYVFYLIFKPITTRILNIIK